MAVIVGNVNTSSGSVQTQLNTEVTVVQITAQGNPASIVEGYIDLSQMTSSDTVTIREYIALDGTTYVLFMVVDVNGTPSAPLIRFHSKMIPNGAGYKVTIEQTAGTAFSVNYWFAEQAMSTTS